MCILENTVDNSGESLCDNTLLNLIGNPLRPLGFPLCSGLIACKISCSKKECRSSLMDEVFNFAIKEYMSERSTIF